ncbi:MAG: hypothetical protein JOZ96_11685 [Acidobacteria bacterium]|nr:hypothetical protein [Acidobacteriota bacterium]
MLYSSHSVLGVLFTSPPWKVFLYASAAACLLLLLPAWLLHLHSIPTTSDNLGFFYTYHWSVVYPIIIPLLLAMAVAVSERMNSCVVQLIKDGRITTRPDRNEPSYAEALSRYLQARAKKLVIIAFVITVIVTLADTYDLWIGFIADHVPSSRNPGWDTAFNAQNWGGAYQVQNFSPGDHYLRFKLGNLFFDVIAYLFQGTAFFLGLFWVGKFTLYLMAFARLIGGEDASYQFNPLTSDLDFCMGLKPMGVLFNNFLSITVVLTGLAFLKRLYLIDSGRGQPFGMYLQTSFWNIIQPSKDNPLPFPFNHFTEFFRSGCWGIDGLDVSALIAVVFMTVPIVVICFLPLWQIRTLVDKRRSEELDRLQAEHAEALRLRNYDRVQLVQYEKQCLEKANIWPNGNARAKRYLTIIFALAAGAFAPPLLAIVLAGSFSDGLVKYFKLIFHSRTA